MDNLLNFLHSSEVGRKINGTFGDSRLGVIRHSALEKRGLTFHAEHSYPVPRAVRLRFVEEVCVPHFCQNTVAAVPHIDLHVVWVHANQSAVHGIINELKLVLDGVRKHFMHLGRGRAIVHVLFDEEAAVRAMVALVPAYPLVYFCQPFQQIAVLEVGDGGKGRAKHDAFDNDPADDPKRQWYAVVQPLDGPLALGFHSINLLDGVEEFLFLVRVGHQAVDELPIHFGVNRLLGRLRGPEADALRQRNLVLKIQNVQVDDTVGGREKRQHVREKRFFLFI